MRTMHVLVLGLGLAACGGGEPEAVEAETTAQTTSGGMTNQPQASAGVEVRDDLAAEEPSWGSETYAQPTPTPEELRTQIETALRGAPNLDDDRITVRVEEGGVYLAGLVDSPTEVRIAHDVTHSVPGVENVYVDELRVQ